MPDIVRGAPEPGTYRYVVAKPHWPPTQTYSVAIYGETKTTRVVDWPEEIEIPPGRGNPNFPTREKPATVMAFVNDRHLRDRCVRFGGWIDLTEEWFAALGHPDAGPTPGVEVTDTIPGEIVADLTE